MESHMGLQSSCSLYYIVLILTVQGCDPDHPMIEIMMLFIDLECVLITIFFNKMDLEFLLSDRKLWYM